MPYTIDFFTNWPQQSSWDALKAWLQSAEGGKLRIVEPRESPYALVRQVKGQSDFSLPHVPWCRSVVVDKERRLPVCVAPPKASTLQEDSVKIATSAEEFVDGTMLNVQSVTGDATIGVATRSRVGGKTRFQEDGKTFEEMFHEAMDAHGVESYASILPVSTTAVANFTSCVFQHPENRIVKAISAPTFMIIHQGSVDAEGRVTIEEDAANFRAETKSTEDDFFEVQPQNLDSIRAAHSVEAWVTQQAQERGFGWQGLILKDGQGRRQRVRSSVYETVRRIRGNESSVTERFARLRSTRTTDQQLAFQPEDKIVFYETEGRLRKNTRQLSNFQADVFRFRKTAYHQLPWPYKHHVSVLHNLQKDTLRAQNKKIDFDQVVRQVNSLSVEDLANFTKTHRTELVADKPTADVPVASEPVTA